MSDPPPPQAPWYPRLARFWPAIAVALGALAVLFVVRPFAPPQPEREVWQEWNEAIGRLGMVPVYPPREDLYVGDVLVVLGAGPTEAPGQRRLGNAVSVGHLDLRPQIAAHEAHHLNLDIDTPAAGRPGAVHAGLIAFPGISVTHARRASSSLGARLFGWSAASEQNSSDKVSIPVAYSYGIDPYDGLAALSAFCHQTATARFCNNAFLHRLLGRAGFADAEAAKGGKFLFPVTIELVTRVYLTKTLEQQRVLQGSGAAAIATAGSPPPAPASGTGPVQQQTLQASAAVPGQHTDLSLVRADDSELTLHQTYDHPLVFGYRLVAIAPMETSQ